MDFVLDEYDDGRAGLRLDRAFALQAYIRQSNPWSRLEMTSDGYLAQEGHRIRNLT